MVQRSTLSSTKQAFFVLLINELTGVIEIEAGGENQTHVKFTKRVPQSFEKVVELTAEIA